MNIATKMINFLRLFLHHDSGDNSNYWRNRAKLDGDRAVYFRNPSYNELLREAQFQVLDKLINFDVNDLEILEVGSGTGRVTEYLLNRNPNLRISCVDFPEMINKAKDRLARFESIDWNANSLQDFAPTKEYGLVLSVGCLSMIRHPDNFQKALDTLVQSVAPGGQLVMIEPFHSANFLARAKISKSNVAYLINQHRLEVTFHKGFLNWIIRILISDSNFSGKPLFYAFRFGEFTIKVLGDFLADYKVLEAKRKL